MSFKRLAGTLFAFAFASISWGQFQVYRRDIFSYSPADIAVDANLNAFVLGKSTAGLVSVKKLLPTGSVEWTREFDAGLTDRVAEKIVVDSAGNAYFSFHGDSNPDPAITSLSTIVVKLDPAGTQKFLNTVPGQIGIKLIHNAAKSNVVLAAVDSIGGAGGTLQVMPDNGTAGFKIKVAEISGAPLVDCVVGPDGAFYGLTTKNLMRFNLAGELDWSSNARNLGQVPKCMTYSLDRDLVIVASELTVDSERIDCLLQTYQDTSGSRITTNTLVMGPRTFPEKLVATDFRLYVGGRMSGPTGLDVFVVRLSDLLSDFGGSVVFNGTLNASDVLTDLDAVGVEAVVTGEVRNQFSALDGYTSRFGSSLTKWTLMDDGPFHSEDHAVASEMTQTGETFSLHSKGGRAIAYRLRELNLTFTSARSGANFLMRFKPSTPFTEPTSITIEDLNGVLPDTALPMVLDDTDFVSPLETVPVASNTQVMLQVDMAADITFPPKPGTILGPNPATLSIQPNPITGGAEAVAIMTMNAKSPEGGVLVVIRDDSSFIDTPPAITVPSNETTGVDRFPVLTKPVSVDAVRRVFVTANGVTISAPITLKGAALTNLTLARTSVVGGFGTTGTVTLATVAGPSGRLVTLSDNSTAITVPESVVVPAGGTQANFAVSTSAVTSVATRQVIASLDGVTRIALLTIHPPAALSTLAMNPTTVVGGFPSTGTVTLTAIAPPAGIVVNLSDNTDFIATPASVAVPDGASTASFQVATSAVGASFTRQESATFNGVTRTANLTLTPP